MLRLAYLIGLLITLSACKAEGYKKYQAEFYNSFDTYTIIVGYAASEAEFTRYSRIISDRLSALHKEYDIYNDYDGINNLKTVNDNAGIAPVAVSDDIIDLLKSCKAAYETTGGAVNIALGPVLRIWHDYRARGTDPQTAEIPPMEVLAEAAKHTDINDVLIDERAKTVFLKNKGMSLDVGAIAKGYAARIAVEAAKAAGMQSALVNVGGNVLPVGESRGERAEWSIGIQDPRKEINRANTIDTVYLNNACVVTSGNYQRFYEAQGKVLHHIIDPKTLMPAEYFNAVTVLHENSETADMLSTALFVLPLEEGKALAERLGGSAVWILHDYSLTATDGYKASSKYFSSN